MITNYVNEGSGVRAEVGISMRVSRPLLYFTLLSRAISETTVSVQLNEVV